jgi:hypothetical protein
MICPTCHRLIPAPALVCRVCLEKHSWSDARTIAGRRLAEIRLGQFQVHLMRKAPHSGVAHIALPYHFGSFCGIDLRDHAHSVKKTFIEARLSTFICGACVAAIDNFEHNAAA